ncbi:MAG: hypothetical protein DWI23_08305 [Planctomycetota bacterium]|nr:MAG: hypothetical protein DWI23_08305 [Planctomycetota bacterium]
MPPERRRPPRRPRRRRRGNPSASRSPNGSPCEPSTRLPLSRVLSSRSPLPEDCASMSLNSCRAEPRSPRSFPDNSPDSRRGAAPSRRSSLVCSRERSVLFC